MEVLLLLPPASAETLELLRPSEDRIDAMAAVCDDAAPVVELEVPLRVEALKLDPAMPPPPVR